MRRLNRFEMALGILVMGSLMVSLAQAQKSACDPLKAKTVTQGLYGICVAFCGLFPKSPEWESCVADPDTCGEPAAALLQAYEDRRRPTDPDMPCLISQSKCPCWDGSATALPGGINLAQVWTANAPPDCAGLDQCIDETTPGGPASHASCISSSTSSPTGSLFTSVSAAFPPLKFCQAIKITNGAITGLVSLALDDATFDLCLDEHDAFTVGGTFPSYNNNICGLPTP
jgi:hypothetical protein